MLTCQNLPPKVIFPAEFEGEGEVAVKLFVPKRHIAEQVHDNRDVWDVRNFFQFFGKFFDIVSSGYPAGLWEIKNGNTEFVELWAEVFHIATASNNTVG
jgi:hypothetical protein